MIDVDGLVKKYGGTTAVAGVSFRVERGELVALVGDSGSGKTTTLKMINRLIEPDAGRVSIDGRDTAALERLRVTLGSGFAELLSTFVEDAEELVKTMRRALVEQRADTLRRAAHSLKSATSNLGGRGISEQLDRCESLARDGANLASVRSAAVGLRQAYAAFETALKELTGRRTGT